MRRAALQNDAQKLSLFPFLAVLICTMGALLVLLVVIARQAMAEAEQSVEQAREQMLAEAADRQQAAQEQAVADAETAQQAAQAKQVLEHRIEVLARSRAETETQMRQLRQALADQEDHMNRLIARLRSVTATEQELANQATQPVEAGQIERDIESTRQAIEETRRQLADAEAKAAARQPSYSIIPYKGPNGTQRVPIYLECLSDAVVVQPFGIRLTEEDFTGDMSQNNPLAAALRAAAGFVAREQTGVGQPSDPPYPLLVVRPSGIHAYYAARAAMSAWTADFGYELIDEEWPLEFAAGDPRMGEAMVDAIAIARQRRAAFLAAGGRGGRYVRGGGAGGGQQSGAANSGESPFGGTPRGQTNRATDPRDTQTAAGDGSSTGGGPRLGNPGADGSPQGPRVADPRYEGNTAGQGQNPTPGEIVNQGGGLDEAAHNPAEDAKRGTFEAAARPIADARGEGWAELGASKGSTPVTRPVALVIAADRVVILTHAKAQTGKTVRMPAETSRSVDELVSAVWDHMRGWGIAGRGLYWKPTITARVLPGGELRASELQNLLQGSGMEINFSR